MSALKPLSFLVVDDNRHMLAIIRTMLAGFDVKKVYECVDAAQAFEVFRNAAPDMLLIDYNMAPLDGLDFMRLVRKGQDSPNPYVPAILITAYSERSRVEAARDAGINEVLVKPLTAKRLYERICSVINNPRPFIRTEGYIGPCRRRVQDPNYSGTERRQNVDTAAKLKEQHAA